MKRRRIQDALDVIAISQPHHPAEVARLMVETKAALIRMLEGTAEDRDLARLGTDLNVALVSAQRIGNSAQALEVLAGGAEALAAAQGIKARHGRYGLTGPGRAALSEAIDVFESILAASSPMQMHRAEEEVSQLLRAPQKSERPRV